MGVALLSTASTASNKDQDSRDKIQGGGGKNAPDGRTPASMEVVGASGVDGVLDDLEAGKVTGHGDDCDDKGQEGEERGDKGAEEAGAEAEQEGQEGKASSNGVQNQNSGENPGGIAVALGEGKALDSCESGGGIVANVSLGAVIRSVSDDAVSKCAKCYSVYSAATTDVDLQDREVVDHRRGDRHDNKESRGSKQQHCAEVVKECADTHDERLHLLICLDVERH